MPEAVPVTGRCRGRRPATEANMTAALSTRESLHWLDWLVRVRKEVLVGVCCSVACGAGLLYLALRMRGTATAVALVFALMAPYVVLLLAAFKALSIASSMAHLLHQREQQLTASRRELARRNVPRDGQAALGGARGAPGEALATFAHDLREPLQLIESNVAVLSEAFGDILPVLDQHEASGPHIRVARLDYPFFRNQVPVILQDLAAGTTRIAGLLRDVAALGRSSARRAGASQADAS
jgi:signal transduction histidine kinase